MVGRAFDAVVEREIREAADGASNVRLDLRWVPTEEVQTFFAASDLVVLPYRRILNSGALMLALTLACPVLVPDLGSMRDQQARFGAEWVRLYPGELTPEDLAAACAWAARQRDREPDLAGGDWVRIAQQTRAVYGALLSRPQSAVSPVQVGGGRTWTGA